MQIDDDMSYRTRFVSCLSEIGATAWDGLQADQATNPFLSYAFLHSLHESGCASAKTGWQPHYLTIWQTVDGEEQLVAALPQYLKSHSYGEYVFDWAWANAYEEHNLAYYPKLLSAIPFTPVTGPRLLVRPGDEAAKHALLQALCQERSHRASCHILFPPQAQAQELAEQGFLLRKGVQFHWINENYQDFEHFLSTLEAKKRKNIRAERRKVLQAGVSFRQLRGAEASVQDWEFFVHCYNHTYAAHRSSPYLNLDFFLRLAQTMPQNLLLIIAQQHSEPIAASLVIHDQHTLYGRYWGALVTLPCLHFETAYYQSLEFCIRQQIRCFEGGAQGEHKMARGFLPQTTWSAHWLRHPAFSNAIEDFLRRECKGMSLYMDELNERNPFRPSAKVGTDTDTDTDNDTDSTPNPSITL